jgi:hypothetical protein
MEETIKKDFLFGLTAHKHSLGHIVPPKQEAYIGCYKLKEASGVKTTNLLEVEVDILQ